MNELDRDDEELTQLYSALLGREHELVQDRLRRSQQLAVPQPRQLAPSDDEPTTVDANEDRDEMVSSAPLPYRMEGNCIVIEDDDDDLCAPPPRQRSLATSVMIDLTNDGDEEESDEMSVEPPSPQGCTALEPAEEPVESIVVEEPVEIADRIYRQNFISANDFADWINMM